MRKKEEPGKTDVVEITEEGKGKPKKKSHKLRAALLIILAVVVLAVIFIAIFFNTIMTAIGEHVQREMIASAKDFTLEEFDEAVPVNQAQAAAVDAMQGYGEDDTWAVYIYMCGSDLESQSLNEMSLFTTRSIQSAVQAVTEAKQARQTELVETYVDTVRGQGMDLPALLYYPDTLLEAQTAAVNAGASAGVSPDSEGAASNDIREIAAVELPANIKVVLQTGGAKRWELPDVNPNRSMRFLFDDTSFYELEDNPIENMGEAETLADFLRFCKENYPADHTIFLFWNHGGGSQGVCWDEVFGSDNLAISEMREGFSQVYDLDEDNPPFEMIGFDACLMASLEVAHGLSGVARYMCASEEIEPGTGWDHTAWLSALAENPGMNGAQVGKVISDTYLQSQHWLTRLYESAMMENMAYCFSVTDLTRVNAVYEAYAELCGAILRRIPSDAGAITEASIAADRSIKYSTSYYEVYNTIDLGVFADELAEVYPEEVKALKAALADCVLYTRGSSYEEESQGLSVFFPIGLSSENYMAYAGLKTYLDYIYDTSDDERITALYFYKFAGCLSPELQESLKDNGFETLPNLDIECLEVLPTLELTVDGDSFSFPINTRIYDAIQDAVLTVGMYDEETEYVAYFGEDKMVEVEEDKITSSIGNRWMSLDSQPLATTILDASEERVLYSSLVEYNGTRSYLITSYDFTTGESKILGIRHYDSTMVTLDRTLTPVQEGDTILPLYLEVSVNNRGQDYVEGEEVKISSSTKIGLAPLSDGIYMASVTVEDCRSDTYDSGIVMFTIKDGKLESSEVCDFLKVY